MPKTLLVVAFLPLAAIAARLIVPTLRPRRHRPVGFWLAGAVMFLFGAFGGFVVLTVVDSGVVDFTSRQLGRIYADSSSNPLKYWATVLSLYAIAVFLSGVGIAGAALSLFRRDTHAP